MTKHSKMTLLSAALAAFLLPAAAQTSSTPNQPSATPTMPPASSAAPSASQTPAPPPTANQPETGKEISNTKAAEQKRIANGMKDGQLTSGEAQTLENKEHAINSEEYKMRQANGGKLTAADKAQLAQQQKQVSGQIYKDKHNGTVRSDKPESGVSGREENQENRIANGEAKGQLTAKESSQLEAQHNQIKSQIAQDRAANGGHLTAAERQQVNKEQNHVSKEIHKDKKNNVKRR